MGTRITIHGDAVNTVGTLPEVGSQAKDFNLVAVDLSEKSLSDFAGKWKVLNIFPSINTSVCANSVRHFNKDAAGRDNTVVLGISKDLPFAQKSFCGAEGIDNVVMLSDFRSDFGDEYGVLMADGPMKGLMSRAIVVLNPENKVVYTQQVGELTDEPDYDKALAVLG